MTFDVIRRGRRAIRLVPAALALVFLASTAQAQDAASLMSAVDPARKGLTAAQSQTLRMLRGKPATLSVTVVTINAGALGESTVLGLPDGDTRADLTSTTVRSATDYTWVGSLGNEGQAVLTVHDGQITGSIQDGARQYRIVPLGGGLHALVKVDQSAYPNELPAIRPSAAATTTATPPPTAADVPPVVEVLVAYTQRALAANGGDLAKLAQLAVDDFNAADNTSDAEVTVHLKSTLQVDYDETGKTYQDVLTALQRGEGDLNRTHTERDAKDADVVVLLVEKPKSRGLAFVNPPEDFAYAVVWQGCAVNNHSFAHELGHVFGGDHDPANALHPNAYADYAQGFVHYDVADGWRTIMAYDTTCANPCPRVGFFSNPAINHHGIPAGTVNDNDNARVHRERAGTVAAFRPKGSVAPTPVATAIEAPMVFGLGLLAVGGLFTSRRMAIRAPVSRRRRAG